MSENEEAVFSLYDLQVETLGHKEDFVCNHEPGVSFLIEGENLLFPKDSKFSLYALAAILPLIPSKQRQTADADWMTTDTDIACPDPNCKARFRITRTGKRVFKHSDCTVVPLNPNS